MRLGDDTRMKVETISSGALTLDLALGGGLPKGRVIEIYGPESSGKTTLALHAVAQVQKNCGVAKTLYYTKSFATLVTKALCYLPRFIEFSWD